MAGISDQTMQVVTYALRGLVTRAEVRAHNVANSETPTYIAKEVDFVSALRDAISSSNVEGARDPAIGVRDTAPDIHDNTVDLNVELTELVGDNLMFQAMIESFNYKTRLLRVAMRT